MPVYQYRCRECGYDLEARQKFSDDPLTECPNCGAPTGLYRVVQAAGVVFKGSGFYVTDSRGNRDSLTSNTKKADKSGDSGAASSGDSGTNAASNGSESTAKTTENKPASSSTTPKAD